MARIDLTIPSLGNEQAPSGGSKFVDLRDTIPGDSFNWSWTRALSEVKYLAIHHTAAPDTQTPEQIANFHINSNGWGGIGYHFLISKDGTVYYVGDISTARANVANLNEAVIGICLIGNFMAGATPTDEQIDSANKLCDFFINNYPDLPNVDSWDDVKGHKELPGQATACPGDSWPNWQNQLISGQASGGGAPSGPPSGGGDQPIVTPNTRRLEIANLYRVILGRDPDEGGLTTYAQGPMTLDQIRKSMTESEEHKNLIRVAKDAQSLKGQVDSMQTSLASINQQVIFLQETLQERDREIAQLRQRLGETPSATLPEVPQPPQPDTTLTLVGALINLYKFLFWPRKAEIS